ncbi:hypothetical protein [Streptomyces albus]|uniref:hypothetical protein n=1 Tax=Streptomyces albus TaxID=1888 RepID=UPI0004C57884|nr:hypothetical protein [Streptomyces albus]
MADESSSGFPQLGGQIERNHIREGTLGGQVIAASKGSHGGRPKVVDDDMLTFAVALKDRGVPSLAGWAIRPGLLMWCRVHGERRATSLSRTTKPLRRQVAGVEEHRGAEHDSERPSWSSMPSRQCW